jgi:hypothetical protein
VVVPDFFAEGSHMVVDVVVTTFYRNTILRHAALVPGYAAKQAEDRKFQVDRASTQLIAIHGDPHILVPFAMEDGGRLGAHAFHLLMALEIVALDKERRPPFAYRAGGLSTPTLVSLWV